MNALASLIHDEIKDKGPMSLARFMELALYTPALGYYEKRQKVGREGDFFTNVSVGSLFGELLACQFAHWLQRLGSLANHHPVDMDGWQTDAPAQQGPNSYADLQIVEAGAHDGRLASDILDWLRRHRPALCSRLRYCIVEPSSGRRSWQQEDLSNQLSNVKWFPALSDLAAQGVNGIIFSNELLDAMPAHRLGWNAATGKWVEWSVGCDVGGLCWQPTSLPAALASWLPVLPPELEAVLPDGFTIEISPQASQWWEQAAGILRCGTLMTVDYGLTQQEWIQPERTGGTLRSYSKHRLSASLFDAIGRQDITAHVNFSALQNAGERAGLKTDGLIGQGRFLTRIAQLCQAEPGTLEPWTPARVRQFATLTHPEHLGERFRVLIQTRPGD
jgi:SAM-dependent MidA family methyltransferase